MGEALGAAGIGAGPWGGVMTCWSPSPPAASLLRIPCELVLDMGFVPALQDPGSTERQELLHGFNRTVRGDRARGWGLRVGWAGALSSHHPAQVTPLFTALPGFLRLEVTDIRWVVAPSGSVWHSWHGHRDSGVPEPAGSQSWSCSRREGSVLLRYDALFAAEQLPGLGLDELLENALGSVRAVGTVPVLRHGALGE